MKTGRLFWGVFFVAVGALFLAHGMLADVLDWPSLWRFWPLVLVLIGLSLLLRSHPARWIVTALSALLLALIAYTLFSFLSPFEGEREARLKDLTERVDVPLRPETASAALTIETGASRCRVAGGGAGLLEVSSSSSVGKYDLDRRSEGDTEYLGLRFRAVERPWRVFRSENALDVRLHEQPVWRITLECGATRADLDLTSCIVEDLRVQSGASSISVRLGARSSDTRVRIEAGVSAIRIDIPSSSACEIRTDAPLTSKHFNGFVRERRGLYRTENFSDADRRVWIEVDAGVSSVRVNRYGS